VRIRRSARQPPGTEVFERKLGEGGWGAAQEMGRDVRPFKIQCRRRQPAGGCFASALNGAPS